MFLAIASANGMHSFFDAPLLAKSLFQVQQVSFKHFIGEVAKGHSQVTEFFFVERIGQRLIMLPVVVGTTEIEHSAVAGMMFIPENQAMPLQQVLVIFA